MRKHRIGRWAAMLAATVLVISGCAAGGADVPDTGQSGTLSVGMGTPPISLDTLRAANGPAGRWFEDPAYVSVLTVDGEGEVSAGLAEKWGYVGDSLQDFSFTLRPDLKFADGTPLDAEAVVNSFNYYVDNANGPTVAYFAGMTATALDEVTVSLATGSPNPIIDVLLGPDYYAFSPISPAGIEAGGDARGVNTFGAGPYVLDAGGTVANDHYTYTPNENYYDQDSIHFEKIVVRVIPNSTQLLQALKSGQIDVTGVDPSVASTASGSGITVLERTGGWNGLLPYDRNGVAVPALQSPEVRQAIAYSLDRDALAKASYGELASATQNPAIPGPTEWGYDETIEEYYEQDLDKARDLLAQAGYPNGFPLTIHFVGTNDAESKMAQGIASQLKEVGIDVTLRPAASFGEWVTDFFSGNYGMTIFGQGGIPMYLGAQFNWTENAINNPYHVVDPALEAAFADLAEASGDDQGDAAKALSAVVVEEALSIPIVRTPTIYAFSDKVVGLQWIGESAEPTSIITWSK